MGFHRERFHSLHEFTTFSINKSAAHHLKRPFFIMPFLRHLLCAFFMLSALLFRPVEGATSATSQENDGPLPTAGRDRTKQRKNLDTAGQKITATIGFKSRVGPSTLEALPQGVVILYHFIYIDAIVVEMDTTLVSTLIQDDNIAYVEQDSLMYPMAEDIPWGIPAIQADDVTVPAPDPSAPCFTICVVDSGFSVGHEDLVSACTNPSLCLRSTSRRLIWDCSRILSPLGILLEKSSEYQWIRNGIRPSPSMGPMLLERSLPRVEMAKVSSESSLPTRRFVCA
jgi:hypothetical protein